MDALALAAYGRDSSKFGVVKPAGPFLVWIHASGVWQCWFSGTGAECEEYTRHSGGIIRNKEDGPPPESRPVRHDVWSRTPKES